MKEKLLIGKANNKDIYLDSSMLNRHGLITGATGTGKTVSLKVIAEKLSEQGISVIIPDIKGDLISLCKEGSHNEKIDSRIKELELNDFSFSKFPVEVFDVFAENGTATRTTISEMGPLILSKLLDLTPAQEGILYTAFKFADQEGLLIIDIKDLREILVYINEKKDELSSLYGNISSQSVGAIQRKLLILEQEGGNLFFGERAVDVNDFFRKDASEKGIINIINSKKLIDNPTLYSSFLFWILTEINQLLPEVGDLDKPKLVFFFDEAHILFDNANKTSLDLIERLVKTIRSKGVGIFFVSQSPADIPDSILGQLSNKIQHSLRAYSPKEQKAIRAISESFRENPDLDLEEEIQNLKIGQAIVSFLDEDALPGMAEKVTICPPKSFLGPVDDEDIKDLVNKSDLYQKYKDSIDPESAYEILSKRLSQEDKKDLEEKNKSRKSKEDSLLEKEREKQYKDIKRTAKSFGNSIIRSIGYRIGRDLYGMIIGKNKK